MSDAAAYLIRRPEPLDVEPFAALHARVWRTAYHGIMDSQAWESISAEGFAPMWGAIASAYAQGTVIPDGREFWVALTGSEPVGFLMYGPPRDEDPPAPRQLWSLNVDPKHQGSGIAQRLLDECFGSGPAYLWVAQGNARAIRFYERNDFQLDGASTVGQHDGMVELRMVRR